MLLLFLLLLLLLPDYFLLPTLPLSQVIFIISGVVALTILINGTLSRSCYSFLYYHVDRKTAQADEIILHYVRKRIWQKAEIGETHSFILSISNRLAYFNSRERIWEGIEIGGGYALMIIASSLLIYQNVTLLS